MRLIITWLLIAHSVFGFAQEVAFTVTENDLVPATIQDFANWSGVTVKDVRQGVNDLGNALSKVNIDGGEYSIKTM